MLLWLGILLCHGHTCAGQIDEAKAAKVRAGIVYNLSKLVAWPPGQFESEQSPVLIYILGKDPDGLYDVFHSQAGKLRVQGRQVDISRLDETILQQISSGGDWMLSEDVKRSHILFITNDGEKYFKKLHERLDETGVLTVGETRSFPSIGGMVSLVTEKAKIKILVNRGEVTKADIKLGSQFLQHATIVND